jgi:PTH1 family peptidyl-tRNA hydrolase
VFLVVGLGNPGQEYASHRHNIGFMVVDELASRWRVGALKSKFGGEHGRGDFRGQSVILLKPMEFMNLSGPPVQRIAGFYQIEPRNVIVVHDDLDLEYTRVKINVGGGHGGHNGLRSIHEHLGPAYVRVRCGLGHPGNKERVVGHVLGPFSKAEAKELPEFLQRATDAVECVITDGAAAAMNKFNQGPTKEAS